MAIQYAALALAGAKFAAGMYAANVRRQGAYAQADEFEQTARDTMLTHRLNTQMRRRQTRRYMTQRLDQGGEEYIRGLSAGDIASGRQRARLGASGAMLDSGTTQDVQYEQALRNWQMAENIKIGAKRDVRGAAISFNEQKKSNYQNSLMKYRQYYRRAKMTRRAAQSQYTADILNSIFNSAGTYASMTN